jgi:hypothetical protein
VLGRRQNERGFLLCSCSRVGFGGALGFPLLALFCAGLFFPREPLAFFLRFFGARVRRGLRA